MSSFFVHELETPNCEITDFLGTIQSPIGTFGQADCWSIHTPSSWKHPMAPHEVLIDPLSMPAMPLESGHQVSVGNSLDTEKDANTADDRNVGASFCTCILIFFPSLSFNLFQFCLSLVMLSVTPPLKMQFQPDSRSKPPLPSLSISDSDIEDAVNNACYPTEPGKR